MQQSALRIRIAAPPVDSAANEALVRFLSERLGCARNRIHLLRGQTSRHKSILISGLSPAEVERHLAPP